MENYQLTKIINNRIEYLKREINGFPRGGGFESLREHLNKLRGKIDELNFIINDIDGNEGPT